MFSKVLFFVTSVMLLTKVFSSIATATTQEEDLIVYEGARYYTYSLPSLLESLPYIKLPDFLMLSTANYKGYRATWAVIENQLFLIGVEGRVQQNEGKRMLSSKELFPELIFPHKVTRYSGKIKLSGRTMDYEITANGNINTEEIILHFKNGVVVKTSRKTINRQEIAQNKGKSLFEASSFKKNFEERFTFSSIEAGDGKILGVYFDEPEWRATLTPKKRYSHACEVKSVFPITESNKIDVTITSREISAALEKCFAHPFVSKRFKRGGATGIRLRITGDRLHWDTPELKIILKKIKGIEVAEDDLRHWAYIIIDAEEPRYTSIYFNTKTKELICEDESKWPYEPILLDATGNKIDANQALETE